MPILQYEGRKHSGKLEAQEGETLYGALERAQIPWPHGCLAGACGVCRTEILQGEENLSTPSPVEADTLSKIKEGQSEEEKARPLRLACRAKIRGNVSIRTA